MPKNPRRRLLDFALLQTVAESYLQNLTRFGGPTNNLGTVLAAGNNNTTLGVDIPILSGATRLTQTQSARRPSGMLVTAEVVVGTRRAIDYLLSPVTRVAGEAGREAN